MARVRYHVEFESKLKDKQKKEMNDKIAQGNVTSGGWKIEAALDQVNDGFTVADDLVEERNEELKKYLLQKQRH